MARGRYRLMIDVPAGGARGGGAESMLSVCSDAAGGTRAAGSALIGSPSWLSWSSRSPTGAGWRGVRRPDTAVSGVVSEPLALSAARMSAARRVAIDPPPPSPLAALPYAAKAAEQPGPQSQRPSVLPGLRQPHAQT